MAELNGNGNGYRNGNGSVVLKDIVMWLLGALISILLLVGNSTLQSINNKLDALGRSVTDHESRLSKIEAFVVYNTARVDGIEGRERDNWDAAPYRSRSAPPTRMKAHKTNDPNLEQQ